MNGREGMAVYAHKQLARLRAHPLKASALFAGCAALAFVAFATLSPIGLRPHLGRMGIEHAGAFAVIGGLFTLAFPRRMGTVLLAVLLAAVALEAFQLIAPGRHARLIDLAVKAVGAGMGVAAARLMHGLLRRPR